jgi:hypothetical protein
MAGARVGFAATAGALATGFGGAFEGVLAVLAIGSLLLANAQKRGVECGGLANIDKNAGVVSAVGLRV